MEHLSSQSTIEKSLPYLMYFEMTFALLKDSIIKKILSFVPLSIVKWGNELNNHLAIYIQYTLDILDQSGARKNRRANF